MPFTIKKQRLRLRGTKTQIYKELARTVRARHSCSERIKNLQEQLEEEKQEVLKIEGLEDWLLEELNRG